MIRAGMSCNDGAKGEGSRGSVVTEDSDINLNIADRVETISRFQKEVQGKLRGFEQELGAWFEDVCAANILLGKKFKTIPGKKGEDVP